MAKLTVKIDDTTKSILQNHAGQRGIGKYISQLVQQSERERVSMQTILSRLESLARVQDKLLEHLLRERKERCL